MTSLCERCGHMREVVSGKGSRFLLCRLAAADPRFPKYPPQPVGRCVGFIEGNATGPRRGDGSDDV